MKHIFDFENARWFQLESKDEAQADEVHTKSQGAARFWGMTDNGGAFYILRNQQDLTILTTCVWGPGSRMIESKPTGGVFKESMSPALQALAEHLDIPEPYFANHGKPLADDISDFEP